MDPNAQNPYPSQDASNLDPIMQLLMRKYAENQGINYVQQNPYRDNAWQAAIEEQNLLQPNAQNVFSPEQVSVLPQTPGQRVDLMNKFQMPQVLAAEEALKNKYFANQQLFIRRSQQPYETNLQ